MATDLAKEGGLPDEHSLHIYSVAGTFAASRSTKHSDL